MDNVKTAAQLDHRGRTSHEVYTAGFYEGDWDFSVRLLLGKATRGGSDIGEVLATIASIRPKDHEGWFTAWAALGERLAAAAESSAARGHRVSAARAYLRAANYYATAVNALSALDEGTDRLLPVFRAHRAAGRASSPTTAGRSSASTSPTRAPACPAGSSGPTRRTRCARRWW